MAARAAPWHGWRVIDDPVQRALRDRLHHEAMLLADEARGYFDEPGRRDGAELDPLSRVRFSCESLKLTTRLLHAIAWLLTRRAVDAGELAPAEARLPSRRLGPEPEADEEALAIMPERARALIEASVALYRRVERLDRALDEPGESPARLMQERLRRTF